MAYMRYAWSPKTRQRFSLEPHRSRRILANGLINAPRDNTPSYSIQYYIRDSHVYYTPHDSLVIIPSSRIGNNPVLYALSAREALAVIGPAKGKKTLLPSYHQLATVGFVDSIAPDPRVKSLEQFTLNTVEDLYWYIIEKCRLGNLDPSFLGYRLHEILPRPKSPEQGAPTSPMDEVSDYTLIGRSWRSRGKKGRDKSCDKRVFNNLVER
jgi:hypothetical protein